MNQLQRAESLLKTLLYKHNTNSMTNTFKFIIVSLQTLDAAPSNPNQLQCVCVPAQSNDILANHLLVSEGVRLLCLQL